jgi:hypothetical protein
MIDSRTHLALARARQEDMIREARRHELGRAAASERRSGLRARLAGLARRRTVTRPAAQPS